MNGHKIDWDAMEPDWRAGVKTKKQLSEEYGVSRAAIDKHWAAAGIERDLTAKIVAAAKSKVTRATVTREVTPDTKVTEKEVVEANAQLQANIILSHRVDIPRKRTLCAKLYSEIEGLTDGPELLEQLTLALQQGDQNALAEVARKVASLPGRIKGFAELTGAYKSLIALERQAFSLDDGAGAGHTIEDLLGKIDAVSD